MNREDFPFLKQKIIYFDSASTALKPEVVIQAGVNYYQNIAVNFNSIDSKFGILLQQKVLESRKLTARLSNVDYNEVIFTSGTTDSLNQIANMLETIVKAKDEILLHYLNHSSNVIVWLQLAKKTKAKIVWSKNIFKDITTKTKIIALAEINNTLDYRINLSKLYQLTREKKIYLINDAAQAIMHKFVDAKMADFTVYSSNKLYGPNGLGVLIFSKQLQQKLPYVRFGSNAIANYDQQKWFIHQNYRGREPGSLNFASILMHAVAIKYLNKLGWIKIWKHIFELANYAYDKLSQLKNIIFLSKKGDCKVIFNLKNIAASDVVAHLVKKNIILRGGQLCVNLLDQFSNNKSWIRISFGLYNQKSEIDSLFQALSKGDDFLEFI